MTWSCKTQSTLSKEKAQQEIMSNTIPEEVTVLGSLKQNYGDLQKFEKDQVVESKLCKLNSSKEELEKEARKIETFTFRDSTLLAMTKFTIIALGCGALLMTGGNILESRIIDVALDQQKGTEIQLRRDFLRDHKDAFIAKWSFDPDINKKYEALDEQFSTLFRKGLQARENLGERSALYNLADVGGFLGFFGTLITSGSSLLLLSYGGAITILNLSNLNKSIKRQSLKVKAAKVAYKAQIERDKLQLNSQGTILARNAYFESLKDLFKDIDGSNSKEDYLENSGGLMVAEVINFKPSITQKIEEYNKSRKFVVFRAIKNELPADKQIFYYEVELAINEQSGHYQASWTLHTPDWAKEEVMLNTKTLIGTAKGWYSEERVDFTRMKFNSSKKLLPDDHMVSATELMPFGYEAFETLIDFAVVQKDLAPVQMQQLQKLKPEAEEGNERFLLNPAEVPVFPSTASQKTEPFEIRIRENEEQ